LACNGNYEEEKGWFQVSIKDEGKGKGIENPSLIEQMSITPLRFIMVGPKSTESLLTTAI